MKTLVKTLISCCALAFLISSFSFGKIKEESNIELELAANEEFIFGEFTDKNSKIKIKNISDEELRIKIIDEVTGEPQEDYTLLPDETFFAMVPAWEKFLIQNPNEEDAKVQIISKHLYTGYRVQEIQIHTGKQD